MTDEDDQRVAASGFEPGRGTANQRLSALVSEALAELIPALIDRLTPLGELVSEDSFTDGLAFLAELRKVPAPELFHRTGYQLSNHGY